jgi:adenylate cyclase
MESHGTPGRIQITRATYELLKDDFACEPRGTVAVKGKGEMETWYLVGRRPSTGGNGRQEIQSRDLSEMPSARAS